MASETVQVEVLYISATQNALCVNDEQKDCWIPRSQIEEIEGVQTHGELVTLHIPEWLAIDRELI